MRTPRGARLTGLCGIVSLPLLAAGALLIGLPTPDEDDPGSEYVSYFTEHDGEIWLGAVLTVVGLVALLVFLAGLRTVLRSAEPDRSGPSTLVLSAGVAVALFELVPVTMLAGTAGSTEFFDGFTLDPDTAQLILGLGWLPSIYAGLAATVIVATTSIAARRTGALPSGLARAGYGVAVIAFLGAFAGFGDLVLAVWVLAVSVVLIARSRDDVPRTAPVTGSSAGVAV
jgi:hypothetical protein